MRIRRSPLTTLLLAIVLLSVGPERTQTIERAWRPMRNRPVVPA